PAIRPVVTAASSRCSTRRQPSSSRSMSRCWPEGRAMTASDTARIGELLDQAIEAVNRGDMATAHTLPDLVLIQDPGNHDPGELLAAESAANGELRRLTILCCDLVGSTELSERHDPERYRALVGTYRTLCRDTIQRRYDGHIVSVKGDGLLALFGYPKAH